MVPRLPKIPRDDNGDQDPSTDDSGSNAHSSSVGATDDALEDQADMEQEFHTEESESDSEKEEDEANVERLATSAPLLPQELLKPLPSPAYSLHQAISIPQEQMTREQKVAQRNRSRKAKKRVWDRLRRDSKGTGVLEAGRVAQWKRGLASWGDKITNGRITKRTKVQKQVSERQQLLENRKRAIEQSNSQLMLPPRKQRKTRSKTVSAG